MRTSLVHDAELPKNVTIGNSFGFKKSHFYIPVLAIWGLIFMLLSLPCNIKYKWNNFTLGYNGKPINFDECWGNKDKLMAKLKQIYPEKK